MTLHVAAGSGIILVADLGGTHARLGVATTDGALLKVEHHRSRADQGLAPLLPRLVDHFRRMLASLGLEFQDCFGIAISIACHVDFRTQKVVSASPGKFEDAPTIDLATWAEEVALPLWLETDAHAALAGEWKYGAAQHASDVVLVSLGTGIGTSVLIGGKSLRGRNGRTGQLGGHLAARSSRGALCTCGGRGCIASETATFALPRILADVKEGRPSALDEKEPLNYQAVFRLAAEGDNVAIDIRDRSIQFWAQCVSSLIVAYDPEVVVVAGGVSAAGTALSWQLNQRVADSLGPSFETPVILTNDPARSALSGMAYLVRSPFEFI